MLLLLPAKKSPQKNERPMTRTRAGPLTAAHPYVWHVAQQPKFLNCTVNINISTLPSKWRRHTFPRGRNDCFHRHFPQCLKHLHNRNDSRVCFLCIGCQRRVSGGTLYAWVTARKRPFNWCFWRRGLKEEKIAFGTKEFRLSEAASWAAITFIRCN